MAAARHALELALGYSVCGINGCCLQNLHLGACVFEDRGRRVPKPVQREMSQPSAAPRPKVSKKPSSTSSSAGTEQPASSKKGGGRASSGVQKRAKSGGKGRAVSGPDGGAIAAEVAALEPPVPAPAASSAAPPPRPKVSKKGGADSKKGGMRASSGVQKRAKSGGKGRAVLEAPSVLLSVRGSEEAAPDGAASDDGVACKAEVTALELAAAALRARLADCERDVAQMETFPQGEAVLREVLEMTQRGRPAGEHSGGLRKLLLLPAVQSRLRVAVGATMDGLTAKLEAHPTAVPQLQRAVRLALAGAALDCDSQRLLKGLQRQLSKCATALLAQQRSATAQEDRDAPAAAAREMVALAAASHACARAEACASATPSSRRSESREGSSAAEPPCPSQPPSPSSSDNSRGAAAAANYGAQVQARVLLAHAAAEAEESAMRAPLPPQQPLRPPTGFPPPPPPQPAPTTQLPPAPRTPQLLPPPQHAQPQQQQEEQLLSQQQHPQQQMTAEQQQAHVLHLQQQQQEEQLQAQQAQHLPQQQMTVDQQQAHILHLLLQQQQQHAQPQQQQHPQQQLTVDQQQAHILHLQQQQQEQLLPQKQHPQQQMTVDQQQAHILHLLQQQQQEKQLQEQLQLRYMMQQQVQQQHLQMQAQQQRLQMMQQFAPQYWQAMSMAAQPAAQAYHAQWAPATAYDCFAHSQPMGDMQGYAHGPAMVMAYCPAAAPYATHFGLGGPDPNTAAADDVGAQAFWYQQQQQPAVAHAVEVPQPVPDGQAVY